MSRRGVIVEEEFDDDTDLPLPSQPLPNNARGPLLQEISDDIYRDPSSTAGPSPSSAQQQFQPPFQPGPHTLNRSETDMSVYKSWTCVYPIYLDAKRPYGTGDRRIAREKSVWWPVSKDIGAAVRRLGLPCIEELDKCHPNDWENPGRVRLQLKRNGRPINLRIKTKKQLLEAIALKMQELRPDLVPAPPYSYPTPPATESPPAAQAKPSAKGKAPASSKPKFTPTSNSKGKGGIPLPLPPQPLPELASRLSPLSPVIPTGMLIETVKAGMNAAAPEGAAAVPAAAQKGKKKVIRVRG